MFLNNKVCVSLHFCHTSKKISTISRPWVQESQQDFGNTTFFGSSRLHPGSLPDLSLTLPEGSRKRYLFPLRALHKIEILGQIGPGPFGTLPEPFPELIPEPFPDPPGLSRNPSRHTSIMIRRMCLVFLVESRGSQPTPQSSARQSSSHWYFT